MDITETVTGVEEIFQGKVLHVQVKSIRLADGTESKREVVNHPGAVCIVPVLEGSVLLVRQYRLPADGPLLEAPAGTREPGEAPEVCAARELREETGYRAGKLHPLGSFFVAPGYSTERIYAYLATELIPDALQMDADERLLLEALPIETLTQMIYRGEIIDAKTIASVLMALPLL